MGRRRIEIEDFVRDVRAATSDADLMKKYGLSRKVLDDVFSRLVKAGKLDPADLMRDVSQSFESTLVVATTCPRCGSLLWADSGECSNCLANRISDLIDDKEKSNAEAVTESSQIPGNQIPDPTEASTVEEPIDHPLPEEEFTFSDLEEGVTPEPDDAVDASDERDEPEIEGLEEIEKKAPTKRRWPAIAAVTIFGVVVSLAALVYTEVLELPEMLRTAPRPSAAATKPQPPVVGKSTGALPAVPKQVNSDRGPSAPGKRRSPELQVATVEKSTEPQGKPQQQSSEKVDSTAPSHVQQTGPVLDKSSPAESLREPTPPPQTISTADESALPEPAAPGQVVAVVPPPEAAGKRTDAPAAEVDLNAALTNAVAEGQVRRAITLLDRGADVNAVDSDGSPLLMVAARLGNESLVDLLLERGADAGQRDKSGLTALALACEAGNGRIIELLLSHDKRKGAADLLEACAKGQTKLAKLLLDHGADMNARDSDGGTPLMIAASKGHLELVEALLNKGADAIAQDNKGFTALAWAYSPTSMNVTPFRVQREIIRLIKHYETGQATASTGD